MFHNVVNMSLDCFGYVITDFVRVLSFSNCTLPKYARIRIFFDPYFSVSGQNRRWYPNCDQVVLEKRPVGWDVL